MSANKGMHCSIISVRYRTWALDCKSAGQGIYNGATQKMELEPPDLSRDVILMALLPAHGYCPQGRKLDGKLTVFFQLYWITPPVPKTCLFLIKCSCKSFGCKRGLSC